jgi:hypothetical protein
MRFSIYTSTKTRFQKIFFDWLNWLMMLFFFTSLLLIGKFTNDEDKTLLLFALVILYIFAILFFMSSKVPLLGNLDKNLLFEKDKIIIADREIPFDSIQKIEIHNDDFDGQRIHSGRIIFDFGLSNGTGNSLFLKYKDGTEKKVYFYQKEKDEMNQMETLLVHYHQVGILHFLKLIVILRIDDYDEIQQFKQKYELGGA